jgi:predicted metal-dependent phosphoesterase TrpH
MPWRQPFTSICQLAARKASIGRADLHLHTTHSDGTYTPTQIVELARRSGLAAIALTDHDTLGGVAEARTAAVSSDVEVIAGVEISAEYRGTELHLLGYFVDPDDPPLLETLDRLCRGRQARFWTMAERLRQSGVELDNVELQATAGTAAVGRRNLAEFLVRTRRAGSVREAFARYLGDHGRVAVPKVRLPVADAIACVRGAGGVAGWAHPSRDCTRETLDELRGLGLGAVEAEYPGARTGRTRELRALAAELRLAVTGGSDCHGPGHYRRAVGARTISAAELDQLRQLAASMA